MRESNPPAYTNLFGRTRRIPDLRASDRATQRRAKRKAVASKVQGTAAELTKVSLVRVQAIVEWFRQRGVKAQIVTTIHDEIQVDVERDHAHAFARMGKAAMQDFNHFHPVPVIVEAEWSATDWGAKKPVPMVH